MMAVPKKSVEPKDRATLWKETLMGGVLFVFGLVLIWQYVEHSEHGHIVEKSVLYIGVGCISWGLWMTNKKLTKEWLAEVREFFPFLRKRDVE